MTQLAVHAREGRYDLEEIRHIYRTQGLVVLKEFHAPQSRADVRQILERRLEWARTADHILKFDIYPQADFLLGDLLAIRELEKYDYLFFRAELLRIVAGLLETPELIYCGDSSVQYGEAARGFHKDNVERYDGSHDDWIGDYGLIRCAFYCQDHTVHSGGLKVRLRSHNIATHLRGKIADVGTQYGDVVLWSMRLTHSGNNKKLRLLGGLPLHPRLEMVCPAFLTLTEQARRISCFCSFARPGSHAERYIANLNVRAADYKEYFRRARKPTETAELMRRYGVVFRQPNDYYGELNRA